MRTTPLFDVVSSSKLSDEEKLSVAAWGNHGRLLNRGNIVTRVFDHLHCIQVNKSGHPSHPLYLSGSLMPEPMKNVVGGWSA